MQLFIIDHKTHISPNWREAFTETRVIRPPVPDTLPADTQIAWIGTDLPDWQDQVKKLAHRYRIVVHSRRPHDDEAITAFDLGAHGYCHSLTNVAQLRAVAATVGGGSLWIGPDVMARMIRTLRTSRPTDPQRPPEGFELLTRREREVARAVTTGASNKEIARQLGMTERTVKMHLGSVFKKLEVNDRMQLVLYLTGFDLHSVA